MKRNFRIFIAYRGESEGKPFGERLYKHLTKNILYKKEYGDIYFSPETLDMDGNFKKDVPNIMKTVEYMIIPLTKNFFDGFWDEESSSANDGSITYSEIKEAINNDCRFIVIKFEDGELDQEIIKKVFEDKADILTCAKLTKYTQNNEQTLFNNIASKIYITSNSAQKMSEYIKSFTPNIFLSFKGETEDEGQFPLYERLNGIKTITLLNFAATSFITGIDTAESYESSDLLKQWFNEKLTAGEIRANLILTNPHGPAAIDAAAYKMKPVKPKIPIEDIILTNLNKLFVFKTKNPNAKLDIYLTDISLPYGVMISEYPQKANNYIKIDLYSAVLENDYKRPSFYVQKSNPNTQYIYDFFKRNVSDVTDKSYKYDGHANVSWLSDQNRPIIHRAVINKDVVPHTKGAYDACIKAELPIEVDLLLLSDGTIVVGRAEEEITCNDEKKPLSECKKADLRKYNKTAGDKCVFTLKEFLEYIHNRIPLLIEVKNDTKEHELTLTGEERQKYVRNIMKIVKEYYKKNPVMRTGKEPIAWRKIAFHSTDPEILRLIKEVDCLMPCGVISMNFAKIQGVFGDDFLELHSQNKYFDILEPDFISYGIADLTPTIKEICTEHKIPLLAWAIKNKEEQYKAMEDYVCDNIIIEGEKTYI